ncbi:MAG: D-alanyl-D-alanine carboxypeptidase [Symploca sp. SIO2G7]|nr:D-alanyl-D-alanine carboxypeptidase [Symploca sp. SIO2G7]
MLNRFGAGLIIFGLVAVLFKVMGMQLATPMTAETLAWNKLPLFQLPSEPDSTAEAIMRQYLQDLRAKGAKEQNQGIWMQSGIRRLASNQDKVPLSAASFTKIATTIAALDKWAPSYQFETLVSATAPVKEGILQGDLVITGSGDPFFVWEEAIALGNSLQELGIKRVTGNLVIAGDFYMNFKQDPVTAGQLLKQGLDSRIWTAAATAQYSKMPPGTPKPEVEIAGEVKVATTPISQTSLLLRHRSLPLTDILREMNIYSNNVMAQMLADAVGGAQNVSQVAAKLANVPSDEIQLINGSGLGVANRISPRAACAMLMAMEYFLQPHQLTVADLFPVAGRDKGGTMEDRNIPTGTAVKTGTLNQVSALAGIMPTRDRDSVCFAIINNNSGDILSLRKQQDQLLGKLSQAWGIPSNADISTTHSPGRLGDPNRNERLTTQATGNRQQ